MNVATLSDDSSHKTHSTSVFAQSSIGERHTKALLPQFPYMAVHIDCVCRLIAINAHNHHNDDFVLARSVPRQLDERRRVCLQDKVSE